MRTVADVRAIRVPHPLPCVHVYACPSCDGTLFRTKRDSLPDFEAMLNAVEFRPDMLVCPTYERWRPNREGVQADLRQILRWPLHALHLCLSKPNLIKEAVLLTESHKLPPHIVFNLNMLLFRQFNADTLKLVRFLATAAPLNRPAYVNLDFSLGQGIPFHYETARTVRDIVLSESMLGFCVSGGITPQDVADVYKGLGSNTSIMVRTGIETERRFDPVKANALLDNAVRGLAATSRI